MSTREIVLDALVQIVEARRYSNLVLRTSLEGLREDDKRLITYIVYGTLQNDRYLRYQYATMLEKTLPEEIMLLLDFSIYQLLFMSKIPSYAVVSEAVAIAKKRKSGRYAKVVNAILRQVMRNGIKAVEGDEFTRLALTTSHPMWLVNMWKKQYGEEVTRLLCHDNTLTPLNMGRLNTLQATRSELEAQGFTLFADDCYTYDGSIAATPAYESGAILIQDYASQKIAPFLAPKPTDLVLDACAAPGTKTSHLAQVMQNQGEIIALDLHEHRVELIKQGLQRLHIHNVKAMQGDATKLASLFPEVMFDKILVDAPCTGYGVMKRKCDIKVHLKPEDMDGIIQIQREILDSAAEVLKPGGSMVYSTCTLNKKENEFQVKAFLDRHPDFVLVKEETIFPYTMQSDGFYMAKLEKK
ncbi:MAG: 16S rRNA (cytosine(967)-C(5))-methyltransferase RsmB [Erysipelotrichaceae bacterium]